MTPISTRKTPTERDWPAGDRDHSDSGPAVPRSLLLRIRVAANRDRLTRELAEGVEPGSSPELALRAAQLTSGRARRQFARTLRRTVAEAHRPSLSRSRVVIINRTAVLEAEGAIRAMIERLSSPAPVSAEGMAIAERVITNADASPLYNRAEAGTLRRQLLVATEAMRTAATAQDVLRIAA